MLRSRGRSFVALVRAFLAAFIVVALFLPALAAPVAAADPPPDRVEGQQVYDDGLLGETLLPTTQQLVDLMAKLHDVNVIVVARHRDGTVDDPDADATQVAHQIVDDWGLERSVVLVAEAAADDCNGGIGVATAGPLPAVGLDPGQLVGDDVRAALESCAPGAAAVETLGGIVTALAGVGATAGGGGTGEPAPNGVPAGPPFPDPETDRAVYDQAGVFSKETIANAEATIDAIEARTGAEVVVYSQVGDYGITTDEADDHAQALMDQWGIGRKGFDDGMVVFFDIDPSGEHGQVQLYAAPGFEATYLTNEDRQKIFENDMVPFLRDANFDGALDIAMQRIDAAATPENAAKLQVGRQVNAAIGLVGAPIVFLGLAGWAFFSWRRYGKDPVYLDDPSILMPAPPPDLTAASGAFVMDGRSSRRALTTAMLDLASRGLISFREDKGMLGLSHKVGIETSPEAGDAVEEAQRARNARKPIGPAEDYALRKLRVLGDGKQGFIEPDKLPEFGSSVSEFDSKLEDHVVSGGWVVEKPSRVVARWVGKGVLAIFAGGAGIFLGVNLPASGLVVIGAAAIAGGIVVCLFAPSMPRVTLPGAMVRAMLAAYKRTLEKTMEQARSMQQVVDQAGLTWLETPDQAVVWGTALGLQGPIESVLQRSLQDVQQQPQLASSTYFPGWYRTSSGESFAGGLASGSGGSIFSASPVPDIGGMMSALGTIGNSPASSGGGGGGFGGGGSGGGGGGAGGGF